ncbi:hypothetical protein CHS0354_030000 [Potamilus streckersoni]|uniref:Unspecific monooxygenase n=1 Tax=Potamilus streckersoni TaxID=2493646 RepID=A0AAE0VYB9_9BIVA|nr:hypothetical protein CHS0354_030000 [Potamilus streckersoni]
MEYYDFTEVLRNMDMTSILVFCVVFLLCCYALRTPDDIPPGPVVAPLLGNIPQLAGRNPLILFQKWRKQYGDVFSVYMGSQLLVVLNGYKTIKEALVTQGNVFSDRPQNFMLDKLKEGEGVIFTSGTSWKIQRKFTLNSLQDLGFGRDSFEVCIAEEAKILIELIRYNADAPLNLKDILRTCVSNVICGIVFGRRFSHDDRQFLEVVINITEDGKLLGNASILTNCFPFLQYLPGDLLGTKTILEHRKVFQKFYEDLYQSHQSTLDENNPRDFMDLYLTEMKRKSTRSSKEENTYSKAQLMALVGDLFGAGTETTATTLLWLILYFLHYPDVQKKCFDEVQTVLGLEKFPSIDDRSNLPYTEATILETLRIAAVAPLALPHSVSRDVYFQGFRIPKESNVLINLDSIFHDSNIFKDPGVFRPERFLDSSGQVMKPEAFIPFSCGRRICIGEKVAQMELFIFLTSMMQKFQFLPDDPRQLPGLEGHLGITYSPNDFKVRTVRRQDSKSH